MSKIIIAQDDVAKLSVEENEAGSIFLHFDVQKDKFTLSEYKKWHSLWGDIKQLFKDKGHTDIWSCVPKDDHQINKFQYMFGFEPRIQMYEAIIYRQEL